ncbi:RNA polymerase sigma factor SigZ [Aquipluma nitroreducens]|uniref:RNA polymerase sigma factor SigZ n=1 Tax=Aquipluma nitroreducens TaxID=2010828 RepID=A0A5K7S795_9BACT|nr:sigma-70 family RNA polymerase sigma factor [Aquipluma nitroreducens]BBE17406.1 RNA polymerase sigma factor SigZ [Aquipluma nitroreducens]
MEQKTTELWHRFSDGLLHFIRNKVKDEALADDLLQETFIRIHSKIDNLRDETKVQSWVFQIARNIINDHYRRNNPISVEEIPDVIDTEAESDEMMAQTIRDMVLFMEDLPGQDCQALCQVEFEGKSIRDYADQTGITYTAAKSRVARARQKLSDLLMNCCHYEFDKYGTVIGSHPIHCCCCNQHK